MRPSTRWKNSSPATIPKLTTNMPTSSTATERQVRLRRASHWLTKAFTTTKTGDEGEHADAPHVVAEQVLREDHADQAGQDHLLEQRAVEDLLGRLDGPVQLGAPALGRQRIGLEAGPAIAGRRLAGDDPVADRR